MRHAPLIRHHRHRRKQRRKRRRQQRHHGASHRAATSPKAKGPSSARSQSEQSIARTSDAIGGQRRQEPTYGNDDSTSRPQQQHVSPTPRDNTQTTDGCADALSKHRRRTAPYDTRQIGHSKHDTDTSVKAAQRYPRRHGHSTQRPGSYNNVRHPRSRTMVPLHNHKE